MASIKLKHTSGNGTIIHSPAANPSSDITLKLPSTTGSAGQVLKVASANHTSTNAELEFNAGGKFASYAIIGDQKSAGTEGGTFTSGAWQTRDLNTEISDADGIVSISSNQFTLAAGTYLVNASAPAHKVNGHQIRLYNTTDSSTVAFGTTEIAHASDNCGNRSFVSARFTISGSKVYEIQHRCGTTRATDGFMRVHTNFGEGELFTLVEIYKEL